MVFGISSLSLSLVYKVEKQASVILNLKRKKLETFLENFNARVSFKR